MKRGPLAHAGLWMRVGGVVFFGFVKTNIETWSIRHWTLHWYSGAWNAPQVCSAFVLSLKVAFATTTLSLLLGSMAAFGVHKARFFGRDSINILPIWISGAIRLGQLLPEVNVVVTMEVLLMLIPILIAARLRGTENFTPKVTAAREGSERIGSQN